MRRHGNLWQQITSQENIRQAFIQAKKGKGFLHGVRRFQKDEDNNLRKVREMLIDKTFTTSAYTTKYIYEPKKRQIYALPFSPDRIVQHALMQVIIPIWEGLFIHDSYACRKGKGMHKGSQKTMQYVRKYKYCLKCDISKFYPSVDHQVLLQIIKKKIKCKDTLWLIENIIHSMPGGKNVPIGNYTSQWFGNLYMNELDQWLKHEKKFSSFVRYCDDFVLFSDNKKELNAMASEIKDFCDQRLKMKLSKCSVFPVSHGVDFLGYRHFNNYILLRKSTSKRVKKRLHKLPGQFNEGEITFEQFRSSVASTIGWLKWAKTHNLKRSLNIPQLMQMLWSRNDSAISQQKAVA